MLLACLLAWIFKEMKIESNERRRGEAGGKFSQKEQLVCAMELCSSFGEIRDLFLCVAAKAAATLPGKWLMVCLSFAVELAP